MTDDEHIELMTAESRAVDGSDEPPVVARLVIEIRSDGTRTIARGAMEDVALGQKVAVEAQGTTPLSLAWSLAKTLTRLPSLARTAATATRNLLPRRK